MQGNEVEMTGRSSGAGNIILSVILLAFLAAIVAVYIWRVSAYRMIAVDDRTPVIEWVQRSDIDTQDNKLAFEFVEGLILPVISNRWDFDYWPIEIIIQRVRVSAANHLILDDGLAGILVSSVAALPSHLDQDNLLRLQNLIEKNIDGQAGQEMAELLLNYYRYQEAFQVWQDNNSLAGGVDTSGAPERRFRQSLKMMKVWMGEDKMQTIFGKQHALKEYLFQRRRINENAMLNSQDKQSVLAKLEKAFSESKQ